MYNPTVGGAGTVLGASTSAVLANTGNSTIVAIAVGAAIILVAWGIAVLRTQPKQ